MNYLAINIFNAYLVNVSGTVQYETVFSWHACDPSVPTYIPFSQIVADFPLTLTSIQLQNSIITRAKAEAAAAGITIGLLDRVTVCGSIA